MYTPPVSVDLALAADAAKFYADPYGFVMWAFPWQEEGTLSGWDGPLDWQKEVL